jgi:hypothetical protein
VLDPAGTRQELLMLELMAAQLGAVVVENDAAGAGGALVDRSDKFGHVAIMDYTGTQVLDIERMPRGGSKHQAWTCGWRIRFVIGVVPQFVGLVTHPST